ncbi:MAG: hypothetical protein WC767_01240 [Candidatus Paceibacterota bacterium]
MDVKIRLIARHYSLCLGLVESGHMATSPINLFNSVHDRAEEFLGLSTKGRKPDDDLRAAIVFAVTAIDVYFHVKIVKFFREKQKQEKNFDLPEKARELIQGVVAKDLTGSNFDSLTKTKQQLIKSACLKSNSSLLSYLEESLEKRSFQSIGAMSDAMEIMGHTPQEIWGKFDSSTKIKTTLKKKKMGRPKKIKPGAKIDAKVQLTKLFDRRQGIIHAADVPLRGQSAGKPNGISGPTVKKWLKYSKEAVHKINELI